MKKTITSILLSLVLFSLSGCVTHKPIVWDELLAEKDITTIYWGGTGNYVHPASYNGIEVNWDISSFGYNVIKIPGGITTFELKGYTASTMTTPYAKYIWRWNYDGNYFTYNFENEKEYTVYFVEGKMTIHSGKSISKKDILEEFTFGWE